MRSDLTFGELTQLGDRGLSDPRALTPQATTYLNADARAGIGSNGKPSDTIDQAAVQLTRESNGWAGIAGQGTTVSYAYRSDAPFTMPSDTSGFSRFNSTQIDQAEQSFKAWSDVANIQFVRVGSGSFGDAAYDNNATILLANYSSGEAGASAFANFPGSRSVSARAGDVWVNTTLSYNAAPTPLGFGSQVLTHEIGHAIGLSHPSDYNAAPGATFTYAVDASYFEDSRQYTVMSYFGGFNTGADLPGYAFVPLVDDIAAAQLLYGPNLSTRTGDTIYGFHSNAGRPWFLAVSNFDDLQFAVWDAGGNDTFDFSGFTDDQKIDLRAGFFSDVGGWRGNVSIAQGVSIENAIGGSGADSITGNDGNNSLAGGDGGDTIQGGAGHDTITAASGSTYLRGGDGNDFIQGGTGFDDINGNVGNDTAHGGDGNDWVVGGKDNDILTGDNGDDIVYGNLGNDTISGDAGNDVVRGGQGDDSLTGGPGDDWLSGDRGNDTITGGPGADIFHTFSGAGLDRVLDFSLAEGDRVQVDAGTVYTVTQTGADTVVDMGNGDQLILVGVTASTLTPGWIFAA